MEYDNGTVNEDISITSEFTMRGMFTETVTVENGGVLILDGMARDIIINQGGVAKIYGTVSGRLINRGGLIRIYGVVEEVTTESGETIVEEGSVIKN